MKGMFDEAIAELEKEIELNPDNAGGYELLVCIYEKAGKINEAIMVCEKASKATSFENERHYFKGYSYSLNKNYESAISEFEKVLDYTQYVFVILGELYEKINNKDKAVYYYKKFLETASSYSIQRREMLKKKIEQLES
jgi:tetratricopeptide (TPR) repeat protein